MILGQVLIKINYLHLLNLDTFMDSNPLDLCLPYFNLNLLMNSFLHYFYHSVINLHLQNHFPFPFNLNLNLHLIDFNLDLTIVINLPFLLKVVPHIQFNQQHLNHLILHPYQFQNPSLHYLKLLLIHHLFFNSKSLYIISFIQQLINYKQIY